MPRSVNSVAAHKRRKKVLKKAKGYWGRGKNVHTVAKNKVEKGLTYAYRDRKAKKRTFRALWIQRINAGARLHGMSYSEFMGKVISNFILFLFRHYYHYHPLTFQRGHLLNYTTFLQFLSQP